jgi:hypothetical protein
LVRRQRQVEAPVVDAVVAAVRHTPWAGPTEWAPRVQARLARQDRRVAKIESALAQIAWVPVLRGRRRQWDTGQVPSPERWLVTELLASRSVPAGLEASPGVPSSDRGMRLADPTALTALVTPDLPRAAVPGALCGLSCCMTRVAWHVPLAG